MSENIIRPASTFQNDLKVFVGKKSEILTLKNSNKIVENKWYLAWDTGEIFVATPAKKLIQYGGTANNLSQEDIETICKNYTKTDLDYVKAQLTKVYDSFFTYKKEFNALELSLDTKLSDLENRTNEVISQRVNAVLADAAAITYSKDQIDSKISTAITNSQTTIDQIYMKKSDMNAYATKSEVSTADSSKMTWTTGNAIAEAVSLHKSGVYFCTISSTDETYQKGHFYYLNGVNYEDLTVEGGGSYSSPYLSVTIDGLDAKQILIGESFSGLKSFKFTCSDPTNVSGDLKFYEPNNTNAIATVAPTVTTATNFTASLTNLIPGTYTYKLSGVDKKNHAIQGEFNLVVIAPIYYGSGTDTLPSAVTIKSTFSQKNNVSHVGSYQVTVYSNGYIWFCLPQGKTLSGATLSGFTAPFEPVQTQTLMFNSVSNTYNCYRSSASLQAGVYTINIV